MRIPAELLSFLSSRGLVYQYYEHSPTMSVAESERIAKDVPGAHSKNLFLTDKASRHYLVCVEAQERLPINQFRKLIWAKDMTFWTPDAMQDILGLQPWSVSIFWLIHDTKQHLEVFISEKLWSASSVGWHPNRNDATLVISHDTLEKYLSIVWYPPWIIAIQDTTVSYA